MWVRQSVENVGMPRIGAPFPAIWIPLAIGSAFCIALMWR